MYAHDPQFSLLFLGCFFSICTFPFLFVPSFPSFLCSFSYLLLSSPPLFSSPLHYSPDFSFDPYSQNSILERTIWCKIQGFKQITQSEVTFHNSFTVLLPSTLAGLKTLHRSRPSGAVRNKSKILNSGGSCNRKLGK